MKADESGVDDLCIWVIDLEIAELLDASGFHVVECTGFMECFVRAAVAVWVGGEVGGVAQEQVAGGCVEAWHDALLEELDVLWVKPEILMALEELDGLLVVERAGHDVPGDGRFVLAFVGVDGLGEHLEE